jgi:hypothetical protein
MVLNDDSADARFAGLIHFLAGDTWGLLATLAAPQALRCRALRALFDRLRSLQPRRYAVVRSAPRLSGIANQARCVMRSS